MTNKTKPWLVIAVCCGLASASVGLLLNSIGVFYTPVSTSLGVLRGSFTLHITIASIVSAFMALIVGKLFSKYNFKFLISLGLTICVISTVGMGLSRELWHFYVFGAIRGLGLNLFGLIPITMIINYWFVKSHGLATSIVLSFSGITGALASPILTKSIQTFGWSKTYLFMAVAVVLLSLPAILFPFELNPRNEGLLPYGYEETNETKTNTTTKNKKEFKFMSLSFACAAVIAVCITSITALPQHFPGFAEAINLGASVGALMLSASMIGNITSKFLLGFLSDRIGVIPSSIVMLATNLASLFALLLFPSANTVIIFSFFFGAIYSMGSVGIALLTKDFFGVENYSVAYPKVSFFMGIAGAFSASLIGYIYDFTSSYSPAFILLIIFHFFIFISLYVLKNKVKK